MSALPQPKHDICPGDGQPCQTESGSWRCGTSQCGRKQVAFGVDLAAKGDKTTICEIEKQPDGSLLVTDILELPVVNRGRKRELDGQSGLAPFRRYSIPPAPDPKAVDCPYCVRRPRNLKAHCQAVHPDKPEAR